MKQMQRVHGQALVDLYRVQDESIQRVLDSSYQPYGMVKATKGPRTTKEARMPSPTRVKDGGSR